MLLVSLWEGLLTASKSGCFQEDGRDVIPTYCVQETSLMDCPPVSLLWLGSCL